MHFRSNANIEHYIIMHVKIKEREKPKVLGGNIKSK